MHQRGRRCRSRRLLVHCLGSHAPLGTLRSPWVAAQPRGLASVHPVDAGGMSDARRRSRLSWRLLLPPGADAALAAAAQAFTVPQCIHTSAKAQSASVEDSESLFSSSRTIRLPKTIQKRLTDVVPPSATPTDQLASTGRLVNRICANRSGPFR